jgi:hypothetical protein
MDGMARVFDVSDPHNPKQIYEKKIGSQVNMVSQSWDGERVYFTSSLLANWDKTGEDNEQFLKAYHWDGKELKPRFEIDFLAGSKGSAGRISCASAPSGHPSRRSLSLAPQDEVFNRLPHPEEGRRPVSKGLLGLFQQPARRSPRRISTLDDTPALTQARQVLPTGAIKRHTLGSD